MNIDSKKLAGYQDDLKKALTATEPSGNVKRLFALHVNRINDGVEYGLRSARWFYAIDQAYDVSQKQISPTLLQGLIDKNPGPEEILNLAKSWGLDDMVQKIDDVGKHTGQKVAGNDPKPGYLLQAPTFFRVLIPLIQSYVKIRWAKLFNDIDGHPLLKYETTGMSTEARAVGKVVTKRIQRMSSDMGYRMVIRDAIQKMLLYSQTLVFTKEAWYAEKQLIGGEEKIVKEGVRPDIPHITRVFYDRSCPLYTLNTDTGVEWLGYWTMFRFGDILNNSKYWIPDEVKKSKKTAEKGKRGKGVGGWELPTGWRGTDVFNNLYRHFYPCTIDFPTPLTSATSVSNNDRVKAYFNYTSDSLDDGIDITVFYHKLVPKDWGLYDYEYPVWHRFIYAGGEKVIYAEPIFYTPAFAMLYDYDSERSRNSSLGFELMPFQDQLGNLLTQQLLTVKKNLVRIVAVNTDVVDSKDFVAKVKNCSENALRGIEMFEYSAQALRDMSQSIGEAFTPIQFSYQPTAELVNAINNVIGILERLLGYSSQEVGASASHQQSATEVSVIAGASSTRLQLTASFRDDALNAFKRMLYYAMLHYSDDQILVTLDEVTPEMIAALEKRGFKVEKDGGTPGIVSVSGDKTNLQYEQLFADRDGQSRSNDNQTAMILQSFLDRLMSNPQVGQRLPLKYLFKFFNQVADYLGLPAELKLPENIEQMTDQELQQQQEQLGQMVSQIMAQPMEQLSKAVGDVAAQSQQSVQEVGQAVEAVAASTQQNDQQIAERQQNLEQAVQVLIGKLDQLVQVQAAPILGA